VSANKIFYHATSPQSLVPDIHAFWKSCIHTLYICSNATIFSSQCTKVSFLPTKYGVSVNVSECAQRNAGTDTNWIKSRFFPLSFIMFVYTFAGHVVYYIYHPYPVLRSQQYESRKILKLSSCLGVSDLSSWVLVADLRFHHAAHHWVVFLNYGAY
jgi:hypothetical protein